MKSWIVSGIITYQMQKQLKFVMYMGSNEYNFFTS